MRVLDLFHFSMRALLTLRSPHKHTPTHNAARAREPLTSIMYPPPHILYNLTPHVSHEYAMLRMRGSL